MFWFQVSLIPKFKLRWIHGLNQKQYRSWSAGFYRSQQIKFYTVLCSPTIPFFEILQYESFFLWGHTFWILYFFEILSFESLFSLSEILHYESFFFLRSYSMNLFSLRSYIFNPFFLWNQTFWIPFFSTILHYKSFFFSWDPKVWIPYLFKILHFESFFLWDTTRTLWVFFFSRSYRIIPFFFEILHIESSISLRSYILNTIFSLESNILKPFFLWDTTFWIL